MENIEILKLKDRHRIIKEHNFDTMAEVEAYRKAIDDYRSKQLTLTDVSQQRELLKAWEIHKDESNYSRFEVVIESDMDDFFSL